jgi:hypothetical protein
MMDRVLGFVPPPVASADSDDNDDNQCGLRRQK